MGETQFSGEKTVANRNDNSYHEMMKEYILTADLGTSAIKTALFDSEGTMLSVANNEIPLITPNTLEVEMDAEFYWQVFSKSIREVVSVSSVHVSQIRTIGLSVQGETIVFLDANGKPLRNAIVWLDNRAQKQAEELRDHFKNVDYYEISGQVEIIPTWPASKILWYRQNQLELFEKTKYFLLLEDYFIFRLCGRFVAEGSLLCSTLYWDIRKKKYWKEMLDYLGVSEDQLPEIKESGEKIGTLLPSTAIELGLSQETVICTGLLDQAAGSIGVGNIEMGVFSECSGTALALVATVDKPFMDPGRTMPCFYHGMRDVYMAHTFGSGGMVLKWFRNTMASFEIAWQDYFGQDAYESLVSLAESVPPGSDGLLVMPHLQGAFSPEHDPKAKGVFYGVTMGHTKGHFVRAILESITYSAKRNIEVLSNMGISVKEVREHGGGAKSRLWLQIKADILGLPVVTMKNDEAASVGAAIVAGVAVGIFPSIRDAVTKMVREKERISPNPANKSIYQSCYKKYIKLYESLRDFYAMDAET